jgi:YHS domain-containing protein
MPPKQNDLRKLLKLKTQDKTAESILTNTVKGKKVVPYNKNIKLTEKQEVENRKFFREVVLSLPSITEIIKMMNARAIGVRKRPFLMIINSLPEDMEVYRNFAEAYINQNDKKLEDFWNEYRNLEDIKDIISDEDKRKEKEEEEELRQELQQDLREELQEELQEEVQEEVQRVPRRQTKRINIRLEEVEGPMEVEPPNVINTNYDFDRSCISNYLEGRWLGDKITGIYITSKDDISKYVNDLKPSEQYMDITWYPVSQNFYYLICGPKSQLRYQEDDLMKAYNEKNEIVSLKVAFKTSKGFVVQTKEILESQKNNEKERRKQMEDKIVDLLNGSINDVLVDIVTKQLSIALQSVAPNVRNYGTMVDYNTQYIEEVVTELKNQSMTNKEFLSKVADIIVYLRERQAQVFKENIRGNKYLPSSLVMLSPQEKFPEAFSIGIPEDKQRQNASIIQTNVEQYIQNTIRFCFYTMNPYLQIKTRPQKLFRPNFNTVVYYLDPVNNQVYSLEINKILDTIENHKKVINPETNRQVDPEFLERFKRQYYEDKSENVEESLPINTVEEPKEPVSEKAQVTQLTPGLFEILLEKLKECEDEIEGKNTDNKVTDEEEEEDEDEISVKEGEESETIDFNKRKVTGTKTAINILKNQKKCIEHYNKGNWIDGKIIETYIVSVDGDNKKLKSYINQSKPPIKLYGTTWYATNDYFLSLVCGGTSHLRTQEGDVLKVIGENNIPLSIKVAFMTYKGFVVQTEKMLEEQKKYQDEKTSDSFSDDNSDDGFWDTVDSDLFGSDDESEVSKNSTSSFRSASMCDHCGKSIQNENSEIKSIKKDGKTYKELYFCDTNCMEKTKLFSGSSSKKGGRKNTNDK